MGMLTDFFRGNPSPLRDDLSGRYLALLTLGDKLTADQLLEAQRLHDLLKLHGTLETDLIRYPLILAAGQTLKNLPRLQKDAATAERTYRAAVGIREAALAKAEADFAAAREAFMARGQAVVHAQHEIRDAMRLADNTVLAQVCTDQGITSYDQAGEIKHPGAIVDQVEQINRDEPHGPNIWKQRIGGSISPAPDAANPQPRLAFSWSLPAR